MLCIISISNLTTALWHAIAPVWGDHRTDVDHWAELFSSHSDQLYIYSQAWHTLVSFCVSERGLIQLHDWIYVKFLDTEAPDSTFHKVEWCKGGGNRKNEMLTWKMMHKWPSLCAWNKGLMLAESFQKQGGAGWKFGRCWVETVCGSKKSAKISKLGNFANSICCNNSASRNQVVSFIHLGYISAHKVLV